MYITIVIISNMMSVHVLKFQLLYAMSGMYVFKMGTHQMKAELRCVSTSNGDEYVTLSGLTRMLL